MLNHAEQLSASLQRRVAQVIATGVLSSDAESEPVAADIRVIACAQAQLKPSTVPDRALLEDVPGMRIVKFPEFPAHESLRLNRLPPASVHQVRSGHAAPPSPGRTMQELERLHLEKTLEQVQGNRTHAAELLGISVRTMRNKIRQYDLAPRRYA